MVKFSGYHLHRHYIASKPTKYGFKIYILVPSDVLQYKIAFRDRREIKKQTFSKTETICYDLLRYYTDKGYSVFKDSYYTSPSFF